jgi:hypothetical protein
VKSPYGSSIARGPSTSESFCRFASAAASQPGARTSSPESASAARPRPALSIQLWFCAYWSTHQAVGVARNIFCASVPRRVAIACWSTADSAS